MTAAPAINALVPFATRLGDDGLVHVRAWNTPAGPAAILAELDWAVLVQDPTDAYYGPGLLTYPGYALPAARAVIAAGGIVDPLLVVRLPDPPGERLVRVTDPDDPFGWPDISTEDLAHLMPGADVSAPPPGAYIRRVVEAWAATGALPG
ncbi:MAG: hypothetical protein ACO3PB_05865 [Miltoncostaeaceae bacterium]